MVCYYLASALGSGSGMSVVQFVVELRCPLRSSVHWDGAGWLLFGRVTAVQY